MSSDSVCASLGLDAGLGWIARLLDLRSGAFMVGPAHHPPVGAIMILIAIAFRAPHRAPLDKQMCGLVFLRSHQCLRSSQVRYMVVPGMIEGSVFCNWCMQ